MLGFQMRRPFQRHRPAHMVIGRVDIGAGIAQVPQHVEGRVIQLPGRNAQRFGAERFAQSPLVKDETDVESRFQRTFDLVDLVLAEAVVQ